MQTHKPIHWRALVAALISTVLTLTGALVYLSWDLPEKSGEPIIIGKSNLEFIMGSGRMQDQQILVDGFSNGYALLSSGPVNINADTHILLTVNWDALDNRSTPKFFWRKKADPKDIQQTELWNSGTEMIKLWNYPGWQGEISEFGFLFEDDNGSPVALRPSLLEPDSLAVRLRLMWNGWTAFEPWGMKSVNYLAGGEFTQSVPLPLMLAVWFVLSSLIFWVISLFAADLAPGKPILAAAIFFLIAWIMLDIRWASNNLQEIHETLKTQWHMDEEQRLLDGFDGWVFGYTKRLKEEVLPKQTSRILIVGNEESVPFYFLAKMKYHLAPNSAHVTRRFSGGYSPESVDYFIFVGNPEQSSGFTGWIRANEKVLRVVDRSKYGVVYSARK